MSALSILFTLAFGIWTCFFEIPKMLQEKLYKELVVFSVLLTIGIITAILRSLDVKVPPPSYFIAWVFSPASNLLKEFLK